MSLRIGRVTLEDPRQVVVDGDTISLSVDLLASSLEELQALRQQVNGLQDDIDDPVVPVTWSEDAAFDGFYHVVSASVPSVDSMLHAFYLPECSVTLERIAGATAPLIESDASAVVRTNSVGITNGEPEAISEVYHESSTTYTRGGSGPIVRVGADGDVYCSYDAAPFTAVRQAFPSISNRYAGMAQLEVKYGSTWHTVVGQQVPASAGGNWRLSNGLVRFTATTYTGTSTTRGGLLVEVYDSGAWRSTVTMKQGTWDGAAFTDAADPFGGIGDASQPDGAVSTSIPVRVLRNSPETVTIGWHKERNATQFLSLDAGAMFATLTTRAPGFTIEPMLRPVASEGGHGLGTGSGYTYDPGVQRSSNDANGNRYVILYVATNGWFSQNGGIRHGANITAGTSVTWGIGVVLGGSSAAAGNTGLELADQFVGQAAWRQRVVVR